MKILALDLGTTTGYAINAEPWRYGTLRLNGEPSSGQRYHELYRWLVEQIGSPKRIDLVVFEMVLFHTSTRSAQVHGGYAATAMLCCEKLGVAYYGVDTTTLKRHATGKGNAKKPAMIQAAKGIVFDEVSHDEADAICLLHYALQSD